MSSTIEEPAQAERLEDVAVAGAGAENKETLGDRSPGNGSNGSVETPSKESDEVVEAKANEEKPPAPPQAPERSKTKVALIMGSLMVRHALNGKSDCNYC